MHKSRGQSGHPKHIPFQPVSSHHKFPQKCCKLGVSSGLRWWGHFMGEPQGKCLHFSVFPHNCFRLLTTTNRVFLVVFGYIMIYRIYFGSLLVFWLSFGCLLGVFTFIVCILSDIVKTEAFLFHLPSINQPVLTFSVVASPWRATALEQRGGDSRQRGAPWSLGPRIGKLLLDLLKRGGRRPGHPSTEKWWVYAR